MRQATRTMDQMYHCYSTLPRLPPLGTELVGLIVVPFISIFISQRKYLGLLEEVEESGCPQCR